MRAVPPSVRLPFRTHWPLARCARSGGTPTPRPPVAPYSEPPAGPAARFGATSPAPPRALRPPPGPPPRRQSPGREQSGPEHRGAGWAVDPAGSAPRLISIGAGGRGGATPDRRAPSKRAGEREWAPRPAWLPAAWGDQRWWRGSQEAARASELRRLSSQASRWRRDRARAPVDPRPPAPGMAADPYAPENRGERVADVIGPQRSARSLRYRPSCTCTTNRVEPSRTSCWLARRVKTTRPSERRRARLAGSAGPPR